jgi:hypothetical protein
MDVFEICEVGQTFYNVMGHAGQPPIRHLVQFLPTMKYMFSLMLLATSMADTLLSRQFLPTMKYVFINVACHINGRHTFISPVPPYNEVCFH